VLEQPPSPLLMFDVNRTISTATLIFLLFFFLQEAFDAHFENEFVNSFELSFCRCDSIHEILSGRALVEREDRTCLLLAQILNEIVVFYEVVDDVLLLTRDPKDVKKS